MAALGWKNTGFGLHLSSLTLLSGTLLIDPAISLAVARVITGIGEVSVKQGFSVRTQKMSWYLSCL